MNLKQNMQLEASSKYTNNLIAHYQPQDCTNIICNSRLQICKQSKLRIPKLRMHKSIYAISRLNVQITQFHISKPKNLHDYPFLNPKLYKKKVQIQALETASSQLNISKRHSVHNFKMRCQLTNDKYETHQIRQVRKQIIKYHSNTNTNCNFNLLHKCALVSLAVH